MHASSSAIMCPNVVLKAHPTDDPGDGVRPPKNNVVGGMVRRDDEGKGYAAFATATSSLP